MCPVCIANMAIVAAGATSSGGLTAFALNRFQRRKEINKVRQIINETGRDETQNRNEPNERRIGR
ncbi:MAG: hypothetical protein QOG67_289 [Verrucomicrobiota bacterium]|jgi:hypothetical protein